MRTCLGSGGPNQAVTGRMPPEMAPTPSGRTNDDGAHSGQLLQDHPRAGGSPRPTVRATGPPGPRGRDRRQGRRPGLRRPGQPTQGRPRGCVTPIRCTTPGGRSRRGRRAGAGLGRRLRGAPQHARQVGGVPARRARGQLRDAEPRDRHLATCVPPAAARDQPTAERWAAQLEKPDGMAKARFRR